MVCPQNDLAKLFFQVALYFKPKYVLFENVRGIAAPKHASYLQSLLHMMVQSGYQMRIGFLSAAGLGIPQSRQRWIFTLYFLSNNLISERIKDS
jgi:DNA (cytosine-5)-methyltransferase 1